MNECFTDPIFRNFSVERKRLTKEGVWRHGRGRWSLGGGEERGSGSMRGWSEC